jgi:thiamine biosynthesis protein ThiI
MDKQEITSEAIGIGSYPISIIPDQDCCTLFTPRNPMTRGRLEQIEAAEAALPVEALVERAVAEAVVEVFEYPASAARRRPVVGSNTEVQSGSNDGD